MEKTITMKTNDVIAQVITFLILTVGILCFQFSSLWGILVWGIFIPFIVVNWYITRRKPVFQINKSILYGLVFFYILLLLSGVINKDWVSVRKGFHYFLCAVPMFMMIYMKQNFHVDKAIQGGILFSSFVLCVVGVFRWDQSTPPNMLSIYPQHNSFGMALELIIPFLCVGVFKTRNTIIKRLWGALFVTSIVCIYLSGSRGAILGLGTGIFLSVITYIWIHRKKILLKVQLVSIAACIMVLFVSVYAVLGVTSYRNNAGGGERVMMLEASYDMWKDHKLVGIGMAHWPENYYGPYRPVGQREIGLTMPHNMFMYYLSTTGVMGIIGYICYLSLTLVGLIAMMKRDDHNYELTAGMVIFYALAIHGLFDGTLIEARIAKVYFMLLGLAIASCGKCKINGCKIRIIGEK